MEKIGETHPILVDVSEMARILSVPKSWLYQRTYLGTIPCRKIGKYVRFDPNEVLAFFKKKNTDSGMEEREAVL